MINTVQDYMYHCKIANLLKYNQNKYNIYKSDVHDINASNDSILKQHSDQCRHLLKLFVIFHNKMKNSFQSFSWVFDNDYLHYIRTLEQPINKIEKDLINEIRLCKKKMRRARHIMRSRSC